MAKIHEEIIIVKLSSLVRDTGDHVENITDATVSTVEQVVQELVGDSVIVEVQRA